MRLQEAIDSRRLFKNTKKEKLIQVFDPQTGPLTDLPKEVIPPDSPYVMAVSKIVRDGKPMERLSIGTLSQAKFSVEDFQSDDWEIVEDKYIHCEKTDEGKFFSLKDLN